MHEELLIAVEFIGQFLSTETMVVLIPHGLHIFCLLFQKQAFFGKLFRIWNMVLWNGAFFPRNLLQILFLLLHPWPTLVAFIFVGTLHKCDS